MRLSLHGRSHRKNATASLLPAPPLGQEIVDAVGQLGSLVINALTFRAQVLRGDFPCGLRLKRVNYSNIKTGTAIRSLNNLKAVLLGLGDSG